MPETAIVPLEVAEMLRDFEYAAYKAGQKNSDGKTYFNKIERLKTKLFVAIVGRKPTDDERKAFNW